MSKNNRPNFSPDPDDLRDIVGAIKNVPLDDSPKTNEVGKSPASFSPQRPIRPEPPSFGCIAIPAFLVFVVIICAVVAASSGWFGNSSSSANGAPNNTQGNQNPVSTSGSIAYPTPTDLILPTQTAVPTSTPVPAPTATPVPQPVANVPQKTVANAVLSQIDASSYSPYTVVAFDPYQQQPSTDWVLQDTCIALDIPSEAPTGYTVYGEVKTFTFNRDSQTWSANTGYYSAFKSDADGANYCATYVPYSDEDIGGPQFT